MARFKVSVSSAKKFFQLASHRPGDENDDARRIFVLSRQQKNSVAAALESPNLSRGFASWMLLNSASVDPQLLSVVSACVFSVLTPRFKEVINVCRS